jgi:N12 class adenine-specific DNA methylase
VAHLAAPRPDELTQPGTDAAPPSRWRPTVDGVAPTGLRTKVAANLRALETLRTIDNEARPATHDEQAILSRWSSWGALPAMFDSANEQWAELRSQLEQLLTPEQWSAARRTTLNAHYTQPGVIGPVWDFVRSLGFDGGRVLEPGCGSGHFIGFAPTEVDIDWTGVELDPTTARITQLLYPQADIRTEGFEQTALADGSVDLVVGNVPFGKIALHDPRHNRAGHSIHNHFIIKSLRLCRPGGLVAVLTSRYTLDSRNDRARSTIGELGDFVTAIRLPSSTHRAVAGTDAVTDLVVFQRRTPGTTPNHARDWQATTEIDTADGSVRVNTWFADHPDLMLGEVRLGGQYRGDDLRLIGDFDSDHLRRTLTEQAVSARSRGHIVTSRVEADQPVRSYTALPVDQKHLKPGSIVVLGNDAFGRLVDGRVEPIDVSKSSRAEVRALCGLRDVLAELLDVQTEALDDAEIASLQERLSHRYDRYVARYGALNRFTWARTGRTDDNGQEIMRRNRPRMGGFRDDPDAPNVFALEVFDADDQIATKSAVFNRRLLVPRAVQAGTDDPSEAVLISLDQLGRVDLDRIADLLDTDPTDARQRVGQLVYDDPSAGQIETAAAYLSGDVRTKLDAAREAAAVDDRFQVNVDALTAVLPVDLTADEIDIRPGQSWIPTDVVEQFVTEVLDTTSVTVAYDSVTATWEIDVPTWRRSSVTMTSEWGTERKDAVALLQSAANNSPVTVYDQLDDTRVINHQATLDAREKQAELVTRFAQWVWEDRDRANRLSTIYNERFNAHVARSYDGSHLTLPGLASSFEPRAHQRAAVARILAEPTALLAHEVGAGKTATMVIASMELRRLGLVNKPMVVVPNHMLEQFCTEWRALYPAAKVLFPTAAEQGPAGRKLFVARAAVGEWDAVVVTESVFERIPLAPATEARFIERQVGELREASTRFEATMGRRSRTVKDIELRALKLEQRHKNLLHRADKDDGATFEQLGVDYLFVDEAHHAKNLGISTRLQGLGKKGSGYAAQLDIRLDWLRERYGSKVLTLSTATPIANSLSEMWVMQHYARPDRLDAAGVGPFDAWASNFAAQVTRLELAPEGTHYRIATRLAKFRNVPDLIAMFTEFADVKTTADLDLPKPALVNGSAETVVVPSDDQLRSFVAGLGERAERVRNRSVQPDEDNMLKISSEGRAAALDVRLVGLHQPVGTTKLTTAVSDQGIPSSAIIENRHGVGASAGGW